VEVIAGRGLYQIYPGGVLANEDVNLSVEKGEIHALVGENGAGKSTLMKMLYGEIAPTKGKILVKGEEVEFHSSKEAMEKGIGMVHQHFMQIPSMTVAENLVLGTGKSLFVDRKKAVEECKALSEKYGLQVEAEKKVSDISIAMRQKLEILKALYRGAEIFILDEPTAVLTPQETEELFVQLRSLREKGHTILFISHKLQEVKALCDRMTILRDGKTMGTYGVESLSEADISRLMVGREIRLDIEKEPFSPGKKVFSGKNIFLQGEGGKAILQNLSFSLSEGEILGIAGIDGNGQNELCQVLVGTLPAKGAELLLFSQDFSAFSVQKRQDLGISYVSEDRFLYGSAPKLSLEENAISRSYREKALFSFGLLNSGKIQAFTKKVLSAFSVKYKNTKQDVKSLSGGNAQKLIFGREYEANPHLFILNQPTRGIDVGAIAFIRKKILDMRKNKKAVLLISADLTELLSLSDHILVMHEGRFVGYLDNDGSLTEEELGLYMLGVKEDSQERIGEAYEQ